MQANHIHQARIPKGHTPWQECAKKLLLTFHNKGLNAAQVFKKMYGREATEKDIARIRQQALRQGVTLNSRVKKC